MVQKLKDAAKLLKAKLTQDQLEESLTQVTSEDNWQASTHQLHQIANAAYNYQKWERIIHFIWDKLRKSKNWRKIIKTLTLVEFLLKNGPPNCIGAFKYEVYTFKSFNNFSHVSTQGIDRGEAIREKAKAIVELLSSDELLEEERVKAKTIRQKMSGVVGDRGMSYGGQMGDSNTKYESYDSKNYATSSTTNYDQNGLGVYGGYGVAKSTLDKYKDKDSKKNPQPTSSHNHQRKEEQNEEPLVENKKPFEKEARKLVKPGQRQISKPQVIQQQTATKVQTIQKQQTKGGLLEQDIFSSPKITQPIQNTQQTLTNNTNLIFPENTKTNQPTVPNNVTQQNTLWFDSNNTNVPINQPNVPNVPFNQPNVPFNQPNVPFIQPNINPYIQPNNQNLYIQPNNPYIQPTNTYIQPNPYQNPYQQNPYQQNPYQQNPYTQPVNQQFIPNTMYQNQNPPNKQNMGQVNPITISLSQNQTKKKEQDQFGGFESANSSNVNWLNNKQKNLTDFSDFGIELKAQTKQPVIKKPQEQNNGIKIDTWDW